MFEIKRKFVDEYYLYICNNCYVLWKNSMLGNIINYGDVNDFMNIYF